MLLGDFARISNRFAFQYKVRISNRFAFQYKISLIRFGENPFPEIHHSGGLGGSHELWICTTYLAGMPTSGVRIRVPEKTHFQKFIILGAYAVLTDATHGPPNPMLMCNTTHNNLRTLKTTQRRPFPSMLLVDPQNPSPCVTIHAATHGPSKLSYISISPIP